MSNTKIDAAALERGGEVHRQGVNKYRWWNGAHYETEPLPSEEMRERIANVAHGGSFTYAFADELLSLADRYGTSRRPGFDGHTTCTSGPAPRLCTRCGQAPEEPAVTRDASGGPMVVMACRRCDAESLRERSARLESDNRFLREREAHFARVLGVCDGGKYRADWNAAIERLVEERSAALALVKQLESKVGAPLSFVLSSGLLRLPPKIVAELGVGATGRGVVVLKRSDHPYVEVLTNEQWYESLGSAPVSEDVDE